METLAEACLWELSYVNVQTVDLKSYSMKVSIRTLFRRIMSRTNYIALYQPLGMTNQQTAVHHKSKLLLLRLLRAKYHIDKRHLTKLLSLPVVRTTGNLYQMTVKCYRVTT